VSSAAARILLKGIHAYQVAASGRLSRCRYFPSCSEYAREAIEVHGAARGSWLVARRLGRCHPLGGHGFDPVPSPRAGREAQPHRHGAS
jgi:hypothetical protein